MQCRAQQAALCSAAPGNWVIFRCPQGSLVPPESHCCPPYLLTHKRGMAVWQSGPSPLWCLWCDSSSAYALLMTRRGNGQGVQRLEFWTWLCWWLPCEPKSASLRALVAPAFSASVFFTVQPQREHVPGSERVEARVGSVSTQIPLFILLRCQDS